MSELEFDRKFTEKEKAAFDVFREALFDGLDSDDVSDVMAAHNMLRSILTLAEAMGDIKSRYIVTGAVMEKRGLVPGKVTLEHPVFKGHCEKECSHDKAKEREYLKELLGDEDIPSAEDLRKLFKFMKDAE